MAVVLVFLVVGLVVWAVTVFLDRRRDKPPQDDAPFS
jgi:ABC-type transporter Mla subunit MlaD